MREKERKRESLPPTSGPAERLLDERGKGKKRENPLFFLSHFLLSGKIENERGGRETIKRKREREKSPYASPPQLSAPFVRVNAAIRILSPRGKPAAAAVAAVAACSENYIETFPLLPARNLPALFSVNSPQPLPPSSATVE